MKTIRTLFTCALWLCLSWNCLSQGFSLGDTVFVDANRNGRMDGGEAGIGNVYIEVWLDSNGDQPVIGTTTDAAGHYRFDVLAAGNYVLRVPAGNFNYGAGLYNRSASPGNDPAPDPDDNVDGDDNGLVVTAFGETFVGTRALTLGGADNLTLDLGFVDGSVIQAQVVRGPNGHFYQVVIAPGTTWNCANAGAIANLRCGQPGHLATITSEAEDDFLESLREAAVSAAGVADEVYVGGFQPNNQSEPSVGWQWVNGEGPIAGVNGGSTFANWYPDGLLCCGAEPNDCCGSLGFENNEEN